MWNHLSTLFTYGLYHVTQRMGRGAMVRAPDCLASRACVLVSNPVVPMWGIREIALFLPFQCDQAITLMVASSRLRPVYERYSVQGNALRAPLTT